MVDKLPIPPRRTTTEARRFDTPATDAAKRKNPRKLMLNDQPAITAKKAARVAAGREVRNHSTAPDVPDKPPGATATEFVGLRLEAELLELIDAFAKKHRLSRSAAIRKAVQTVMHEEGEP